MHYVIYAVAAVVVVVAMPTTHCQLPKVWVVVAAAVVSLLSVAMKRHQCVTRKFAVARKRKLQNASKILLQSILYIYIYV